MKKFALLSFFFFFCSNAFAQNFIAFNSDTINRIDSTGKRQGYWIITGSMQKDHSYSNETKVEEGNYKDSQKIGNWISYYPNGNNKTEMTFVKNRPNGHAIFYEINGNKSEEGTWMYSRWVGPYADYYPENGIVRDSMYFSQTGKRSKFIKFDTTGKVIFLVVYDNNGFVEKAIDDTIVKAQQINTIVNQQSISHGTQSDTLYIPYGSSSRGPFNGEGNWTLYNNGQIIQKGTFHLKRLVDGESRMYDNNGLLIQIKLYKKGKYVGDAPIPADANK